MLQSQFWIPWMWNSIPTWLHFQQKQPTSLSSWQAHHWGTIQRPSLPLCLMNATLACLQHRCQYPLCSLQTCKSLYLPWWSQLLCSYLAHRLPTKAPISCHQILPRHQFQPCLQCMLPSPHTTLQLDRIFWCQLARLAGHWLLYRWIYDFSQWCSHRSQFYHAHTNRYVNLQSRIHGCHHNVGKVSWHTCSQ